MMDRKQENKELDSMTDKVQEKEVKAEFCSQMWNLHGPGTVSIPT